MAGIGFLFSLGCGLVIGSSADNEKSGFQIMSEAEAAVMVGVVLGVIAAGIGAVAGALEGKDETIRIKQGSDPRLKALILQDLRKKARIKDFH